MASELTKSESNLIGALEEAILCIQWLRQFRTDPQGDEGVPSEVIWLGVIAEAKGHEPATTEDFLKLCILAASRKLDRAAITKATSSAGSPHGELAYRGMADDGNSAEGDRCDSWRQMATLQHS